MSELSSTHRGSLALIALAAASALGLAGCASRQLVPAPEAQLMPGRSDTAVAQSEGVRTTVQSQAWSGSPTTLPQQITPLKVTVVNEGTRPVRINYDDFTLTGSSGFTYGALPPYQITGSAREPVSVPRFAHSGFYVAPFYGRYYPGVPVWASGWRYNRYYYSRVWTEWPVQLPTRDMRDKAIPAGVLQPGGRVSGFLYFPKLPRETTSVTFKQSVIDSGTQKALAEVEVPFLYER
ncbi:MAG: hypothetical protein ACREFT_01745 [Acetobacteraceae bacterium]